MLSPVLAMSTFADVASGQSFSKSPLGPLAASQMARMHAEERMLLLEGNLSAWSMSPHNQRRSRLKGL